MFNPPREVVRMRVIAGSARGIRLKMVPGNHVRPTLDRVKETLFQVIGPTSTAAGPGPVSGTGSLGIEALSRGVTGLSLSTDPGLGGHHQGQFAKNRIHRAFGGASGGRPDALRKLVRREIRFRLVFLDPPTGRNLLMPVLEKVAEGPCSRKTVSVVAEHDFRHPAGSGCNAHGLSADDLRRGGHHAVCSGRG